MIYYDSCTMNENYDEITSFTAYHRNAVDETNLKR